MSKLVCVKTYPNRSAAEVARSVLETNGIRCCVSAEDAGYNIAFASGGAKLIVEQSNVEAALDILQSAHTEAASDRFQDGPDASTTHVTQPLPADVNPWSPLQFSLRSILIVVGAFAVLFALMKHAGADVVSLMLLLLLTLWFVVCCIRLVALSGKDRGEPGDPTPHTR